MPAQRYLEIYEDLKSKIEDGTYEPQTAIPSEYNLIDTYGCSRNTVRRAIHMLADEGYVQSIHGKGVIVIYTKVDHSRFSLGSIESLKEAAARIHKSYNTKILRFTTFTVDERLAKRTGFEVGAEVYYIQRVRYFDGEPVILDNNWFLASVVKDLTPEIAADSVYEYVEKTLGQTIVTTKRTMTVEKASEIDEMYLELNDYNCLAVVTSETFNADGVMFEYTQSRHRPDKFSFQTQARRGRPNA